MATVLPSLGAGPCNVTVRLADTGTVLPILQHGAKLYVVAAPGKEFTIHVERITYVEELHVSVNVDGESIGYCRTVPTYSPTTVFANYLGAPGASTGELTNFKFQALQAGAGSEAAEQVQNPDQIKAGQIEVTVSNLSAQTLNSNPSYNLSRKQPKPVSLPEGKKFFMAPSLSCGAGSSAGQIKFAEVWRLPKQTLGKVTLHYETVGTLLLRKVLSADNPAHAPIIRDYGLAAAEPAAHPAAPLSMQRPQAGAGAKHGRAASAKKGAKRKRGAAEDHERTGEPPSQAVKREAGAGAGTGAAGRDAGGAEGSSAQAQAQKKKEIPVVDLTLDDPLVVAGKEVTREQFAVCDLTGRRATGQWQVQNRVKEEVVLNE